MATQLHNTGEEVIIRDFFEESVDKPSSISIGLFNDSESELSDGDDIEDIVNEPEGSEYTRTTLAFGESDFTAESNTNDNWQVVFSDATYDVSDSEADVDAYVVVISFQAQETDDEEAREHLLFTGDLDQTYDLNSIDSFTLSGAGLEID